MQYSKNSRITAAITCVGAATIALHSTGREEDKSKLRQGKNSNLQWHIEKRGIQNSDFPGLSFPFLPARSAKCDAQHNDDKQAFATSSTIKSPPVATQPSWLNRTLANWNLMRLPIPRNLMPSDPAFRIPKQLLSRREQDEERLRGVAMQAMKERTPEKLWELNRQALEISFGEGMTVEKRQKFIQQYGCTGWTQDVLDMLVELGRDRGIVEIGAGNGQWSRALSDRDKKMSKRIKKFDFILAYDDYTALPLDPEVYNRRTKAHRQYFFDKVRGCGDSSCAGVLGQLQCRGRILMLVYPPPGTMALEMLQRYESIAPENDIVVYVGEGRGGANASNEFFDHLETNNWILLQVRDVKSLGTKGYEKLYILKRPYKNPT